MIETGKFNAHVYALLARAETGDVDALLSLACISFAQKYGVEGPPGPDGGHPAAVADNVVELQQFRRAA